MRIIEGNNVDLITPFPLGEAKRVYGWNHCYRTFTETDDTPNTMEEFTPHIEQLLQLVPSWGVIDKNHLTNTKHEAPLVGIVMVEPVTSRHVFLHVATARKAWRTGLIDEAMRMTIESLFTEAPTLTRIGAWVLEKNFPAKALFKRLGFKFEGMCEDMVVIKEQPENIVYFGMTKRSWNSIWHSQQSHPSQLASLEVSSVEPEAQESREELNQPSPQDGNPSLDNGKTL